MLVDAVDIAARGGVRQLKGEGEGLARVALAAKGNKLREMGASRHRHVSRYKLLSQSFSDLRGNDINLRRAQAGSGRWNSPLDKLDLIVMRGDLNTQRLGL